MVILGIDPSITHCGLAWIQDGQLLKTETIKPAIPLSASAGGSEYKGDRRLQVIYYTLRGRIGETPVSRAAIEGYSHASPFNREQMGEVGGAIKLALLSAYVPYDIWPVLTWRKMVLGSGKLPKDEVRLLAYQRYGIDIKDQHALEASMIAMASYLVQTGQVKPRPKKSRGIVRGAPAAEKEGVAVD